MLSYATISYMVSYATMSYMVSYATMYDMHTERAREHKERCNDTCQGAIYPKATCPGLLCPWAICQVKERCPGGPYVRVKN